LPIKTIENIPKKIRGKLREKIYTQKNENAWVTRKCGLLIKTFDLKNKKDLGSLETGNLGYRPGPFPRWHVCTLSIRNYVLNSSFKWLRGHNPAN
jgi:hypothetical protein